MPSSPNVCPATRLRCSLAEVCRRLHCTKGKHLRPIYERDLTKAELYALAMSEQRATPPRAQEAGE